MKGPSDAQPIVFVIDDDESIREALKSLLRSVGLRVELFGAASEFLKSKLPDAPSCLVLDVRLPGLSGLDFQTELAKANVHIPIIFITGHGDIPMTVRAMKAGAVECLTKPFRDQELLDSVGIALERDRARRELDGTIYDVKIHFESLTPREQEVMGFVTAGLMNKQIAAKLGVSEITVPAENGRLDAVADQVVAIVSRFGGSATKGVSDAGRVSILADVPANREPDFRNAIASIGGEISAPPTASSPERGSPTPATIEKKNFLVQIVEK